MSRRTNKSDLSAPLKLSNEEIIRRVRGSPKDRRALLGELYILYRQRTYLLCLRMVGNPTDAEDLTQDAFIHLGKKIGQFRGDSQFSTWFYRVASRDVLMHLRKCRQKARLMPPPLEFRDEEGSEFGKRGEALYAFRDFHLELTPERILLEKSIHNLAPGQKKIFLLRAVFGLEHHEVAKALGCHIGNSKSQFQRARHHLLEEFQGR